ncbi:hypothetical protein, partial [Flavobacterium sp.]|uniref:hypothetical protein n=1 Tax=Flavobacterium sp. TaxID=239 RepID=UPI00261183F3
PKKPVAAVQTKRRLNGIDVESVTGQRPNFNYKTLHRIAQIKTIGLQYNSDSIRTAGGFLIL